jgi:hypothetical protein
MPRPKRQGIPNPHGRPVKLINWDLVDELLLAGCDGAEIAPHFDMHPHTFYDRVQLEKGTLFTDYRLEKKSKGDSILRHSQYKKAIGATDKGDNTLLIWLGKQRLSQRETNEVSVSPETMKTFVSVMDNIREYQDSRKIPPKPPEEPKKFSSPFPKEDDHGS